MHDVAKLVILLLIAVESELTVAGLLLPKDECCVIVDAEFAEPAAAGAAAAAAVGAPVVDDMTEPQLDRPEVAAPEPN